MDGQGRIALPERYAKKIGSEFFVAALPEWGHIGIFPHKVWSLYVKGRLQETRLTDPEFIVLRPLLGANSTLVTIDYKGRFTIPENLRHYLEKHVIFVGAFDTVRLYGEQAWSTAARKSPQLIKRLSKEVR